MPRIYVTEKELDEQYRLDRLKVDQIETQFVNQKEALDTLKGFLHLYLNGTRTPVINVIGKKGLGKTWLIKYFVETSIKDAGIKHVVLDASDYVDSFSILKAIAELLEMKYGIKASRFEQLRNELLLRVMNSLEAKEGMVEANNGTEISYLVRVPHAFENAKIIFEQSSLPLKPEIDLINAPVSELYDCSSLLLAEDIEEYLTKNNDYLIIILHSYSQEKLRREYLIPLFVSALSRAFIIITSENPVDWTSYSVKWRDPEKFLKFDLQPFQASDIDRHIEQRLGVSTEEFVENVIALTYGRPFLLGVLTDHLETIVYKGQDVLDYVENLLSEKEDNVERFILRKYFEEFNQLEKDILTVLSILDWFNPKLLGALLPEESRVGDIADTIVSYSIVKPKCEIYDAWKIHPIAKNYLIKTMNITEISDTLERLMNSLLEAYGVADDIYNMLQYLTILEKLSPQEALSRLRRLVDTVYYETDPDKADIIYNWLIANGHLPKSAERKMLEAKLLESVCLDKDAASIYTEIIDRTDIPEFYRIRARRELVRIYFSRGLYDDVVNILKVNLEKLENFPINREILAEKIISYYILAKAYYALKKFEKALSYLDLLETSFQESISIDQSMLGEFYRDVLHKVYCCSLFLHTKVIAEKETEQIPEVSKKALENCLIYLKKNPHDTLIRRVTARLLMFLSKLCIEKESFMNPEEFENYVNVVWSIISESAEKDVVTVSLFSNLYNLLGDYYMKLENIEKSSEMYKNAFLIANRALKKAPRAEVILSLSEVAPKLAITLLHKGDKKSAHEILIDTKNIIEGLLKREYVTPELLVDYFNTLRILGKVYYRTDNYSRAIEILHQALGTANNLMMQFGIEYVDKFALADSLKDLFRVYLRSKNYEVGLDTLNKLRDLYNRYILSDDSWKKFETVSILLKVLREIRNHLTGPQEFLRDSSLMIKDLVTKIFNRLYEEKEIPEKPLDFTRVLTWITTNLAKLWYSLSMFEQLYELIEESIKANNALLDICDEELKMALLVQQFRLRLRRAIVKFFSELNIEQVNEDLDVCRKILADLEGKYDEVELAYMKCDLILFDSRVKNSLRQFDQSLINLTDFISIIGIIPTGKLDTTRVQELFDRAFKVLRDIRVLTRRKMDPELKAKLKDIESELRNLQASILKK